MSSTRQDLATIIARNSGKNHAKLAREIAAYLLDTKQVYQLESILRDVQAKRETEGHIEAEVTVAHDVSPEVLEEVQAIIKHAKPNAKTVSANQVVDSSLVGGLKVRLAHEQLDMSVRAKLDTFKRLTTEGVN